MESLQVIGKTGNIKFKIFPVYPLQFAILNIESKKKEISGRGRAFRVAPSVFLGKFEIARGSSMG